MKVLYLINFAGKAGTEKYVENLVRILGKDRITPYFAYNVPGELSEKLEAMGVPCLQLNMGKTALLSAARELACYCRENEIDVIHAQYPRENIVALLAKKHYKNLKVVLTNHLTLRLSGVSGAMWKLLNRHFTPKNHRIIAVCNEGRDIMLQNGVAADRIQVIYNGIEPSGAPEKNRAIAHELGLDDRCFVFTILARYAPEKGLDFLLDSLAALKGKTEMPFCCLICGDGDGFSAISGKIDAMQLQPFCRQLGYRTDVPQILLGSDAYLCSSSCNEAMSFAILEAMNAALPLVVTDVGGNRDLAETGIKCGFVLDFGDVDGFANAMLTLMEDSALYQSYSKNATLKIEQSFDLYKLANDVFETYK